MNLIPLLLAAVLSVGFLASTGCAHNADRTAGAILDDSTLTARVKSALLAERDIKSFDIKVTSYKGNVQLSGFVDSQWQIDKAAEVAGMVEGTVQVTNNLLHKPKS